MKVITLLVRFFVSFFITFLLSFSAFAQKSSKPASFNFSSINVAQVVQLIYGEVLATPYVIDPDVLSDARSVSFRYSSEKGDIRAFLKTFLDSLGFTVEPRNGIDFIAKRKAEEIKEADTEAFVYLPKFRDVHYISRLLSPWTCPDSTDSLEILDLGCILH